MPKVDKDGCELAEARAGCFFGRKLYQARYRCPKCQVPGVSCASATFNHYCIVCFYAEEENKPWECDGQGCQKAQEARKIEVENYHRNRENLSSSGESPPIEQGHPTVASSSSYPIQPSEVQELQEEVAKLKGKVQETQGQIIEVAELREQIKIIQEQNFQEVIELREQIKTIQGQMDNLSVPSWHEHQ